MKKLFKILAYCLCYAVYPFSFLFPRKKDRWAFGSFRGAFNDNSKYLFIACCEERKDIDAAWISKNRSTVREVRRLGFKAYWVVDPRGVFHALSSRIWFFNSYTSDIMFCLSGGAVCVNLWHGVGLKRIEFSTNSGPMYDRYIRRKFSEVFFHPESFRRPDYLISSAAFQTSMFAEDFRISETRCLEFGYPRNLILRKSEEEILDFVQRFEPESTAKLISRTRGFRKVYIYMPTWRDSQRDVFVQNIDLGRLNSALAAKGDLLLLKPHANTIVDGDINGYSNIILVDSKTDVYPVLPFTDVLITDYSSILYDYILMEGKSVILYLYDYEDYVRTRDFYYPFDENVIGAKAADFDALLSIVESDTANLDKPGRRAVIERFWGDSADKDSIGEILSYNYRKQSIRHD